MRADELADTADGTDFDHGMVVVASAHIKHLNDLAAFVNELQTWTRKVHHRRSLGFNRPSSLTTDARWVASEPAPWSRHDVHWQPARELQPYGMRAPARARTDRPATSARRHGIKACKHAFNCSVMSRQVSTTPSVQRMLIALAPAMSPDGAALPYVTRRDTISAD